MVQEVKLSRNSKPQTNDAKLFTEDISLGEETLIRCEFEYVTDGLQRKMKAIKKYDYVFAENGLVAYRKGEKFSEQNILKYIGEEKLQTFINFALGYMSKLRLPAKRGQFVEFRSGMINVCPVGRSCSQSEREQFAEYDKVHKIREGFIEALVKEFPDMGLKFSIGGQISIDIFPIGWDKTYCLQHLKKDGFKTFYFFGDKTSKGGNDYEIYEDPRTIGHTVKNLEDTKLQLRQLLQL